MVTMLRLPPGVRLAVIGDIGGHADALRAELTRLGVPSDGGGRIPPDLRIVQVGDLVHRGPDSAAVVELVDAHVREQPQRWVQLVGNHEAHYLRKKQFSWPERLAPETVATLRDWWASGLMQVAIAVRLDPEPFVISHAGITRDFWRDVLGSPRGAVKTARAANALAASDEKALFRTGALVDNSPPDLLAGPVWAAAGSELVASWLGHELPFSQIHGHTSVFDWDRSTWYVDPEARHHVTLDDGGKHATVSLPGGRLIGVDPGHSALARGEWRSFEAGTGSPGPRVSLRLKRN